MKKSDIILFGLITFTLLSMGILQAEQIQDSLHVSILTTDSNNNTIKGVYNFVLSISNDSSCSNLISNYTFNNVNSAPEGRVDFYLDGTNMSYNIQYYLKEVRDSTTIGCFKIAYSKAHSKSNLSEFIDDLNYSNKNVNSSNYSSNWATSNNGTLNGINITQFENQNGLIHAIKSWWDGLYCQLTGCTMTGQLNAPTVNATNVTANYFIGNGSLLTGIPNPFDQILNTTSNVKFNSTNISNSIINSSGMFIPTGKIYVGNETAILGALRDVNIIKDSNNGGSVLPSILIKNTHKSTSATDFSFAGFFFQANNSNISFDMFTDGSGFFNSGTSDVYFRVNTNHPLIFGTNNLQRLFIEKDGKVGIGQRANNYALEVNGDVSAGNIYGTFYGSHFGDVYSDYIYSQSDSTELANYDGSDWTVTAGQFNTKNITPQVTDTYSIGNYNYRYLKGWFRNLDILGNVNITGNLSITGLLIDNGNTNITGNLSVRNSYWTGYDNSTQNFINTANAQVINVSNNLDIDKWQINVTNRQNLTFERTGDYSCTLSPQFFQNGGGSLVTFWMQKNGVDVPWSNSRYSMSNNEYNAPSINFHFDIENPATDNIRFMWWSDSTSTQIYSSGALINPTRPSIPGIILNCLRISDLTP